MILSKLRRQCMYFLNELELLIFQFTCSCINLTMIFYLLHYTVVRYGALKKKVRKTATIRKRYNQVPHLTHNTTWESNKNTINITNKSQETSPFPAGDHKAAMNRRESMRNTRHKNTNDPQKKCRLGTVSKIFYWWA